MYRAGTMKAIIEEIGRYDAFYGSRREYEGKYMKIRILQKSCTDNNFYYAEGDVLGLGPYLGKDIVFAYVKFKAPDSKLIAMLL